MSWKFLLKRWPWVVGAAVVLYILVVNPARDSDSAASGSLSCTMKVTADILNVRSGPGTGNPVVGRLAEGELVSADQTINNGFRQLSSGRWAAQLYLDPVPGCNCG